MKIVLDRDQIFEILDKWCKEEHGWGIAAAIWEVEDNKEFQGITIRTEFAWP